VASMDFPNPAPKKITATDIATASQPNNKAVRIYTRLGGDSDENTRRVSFRIAGDIDAMALLDMGFAIDGNQALFEVAFDREEQAFESPWGWHPTLTRALADTQKGVVKLLREAGLEPQLA